ncbi:MAG TPA: CocE/NonD family hydrolase [Nocardioides sp.]|nr:CocE/NonD family hydrolase [Nocardioides sp.]
MTSSTGVLTRPPRRGLPRAARRSPIASSDSALRVFAAATAVGMLHALDDAVLNRQPGVPIDRHLPALLVITLGAALALLAFRRGGTGVRAALALVVGSLTVTNGGLHVVHVSSGELSGSDVTGVLAALAGVVLLLMAAALPFLHRGERGLGPWSRWGVRVATVAAIGLGMQFVVLSVCVGIVQTHLFRDQIGAPPTGFGEVTFESSDGLTLSGWYSPSRNRAAVILVNSAGGDRLGSVAHGRLLAEHGYGVLLYDARGAGESEGSPNGYGWDWDHDVDGALEFLIKRPDVEDGRIGALGLSTGADVLLEVAATDRRIGAVVADGATGASLADVLEGDVVSTITMAPVMATVQLLSGTKPGPPLRELAARVSPTPLLFVAAGSLPTEIAMSRVYAQAAREPVELWTLPEAGHTHAIHDEAEAYERRVVGHFDAALLGQGAAR